MAKCPYCNNNVDINLIKSMSADEIAAQLDTIDSARLTGDALEFYNNTRRKIAKFGDRSKLTVPQRTWLKDLQKKYPARKPEPRPQPMEVNNESEPF